MSELATSLLVAAFNRLHALASRLLPSDFRARNGAALRDTFDDTLQEAAGRGHRRLAATGWAECIDVARQGLAARRDDGGTSARGGHAARPAGGSSGDRRTSRAGRPPVRGGSGLLDSLGLDCRFALRSLTQRHSLSVVVALALGIGATTAVFSVVDGVLLRELPYPDAERLVRIGSVRARSSSIGALSPPMLTALRGRTESFEQVAATAINTVTLTGSGRPRHARAAWVSTELFALLGADVALGRLLTRDDDQRDAPPVAMLSHDFWLRVHGGGTDVLGTDLTVDGRAFTVVGVLDDGFVPPEGNRVRGAFDVWLPLQQFELMGEPGLVFLDALALLTPGTSMDRAAAEAEALGSALAVEMELDERMFRTLRIAPLREETVGGIGRTLWPLLAAVALLLLIACANVANLMLTRATERRQEIAVRTALGAGGGRIVRLVLLESSLLAVLGGGVGALIAYLSVTALRAFEPADIPRLDEIVVDFRVLFFTFLATLVVGTLTGLVPALRARRADPGRALGGRGRTLSGVRGRGLLGRALVATQTALALMLVVGAGLLVHSFVSLARVDVGFDGAELMRMQVNLGGVLDGGDDMQRQRIAFFDELRRRVAEIPGVRSTHLTTGAPFSPGGWYSSITAVGRAEGEIGGPGTEEDAYRHQVSGGYLTELGLRVIEGREITDADSTGSLPVAVVNQSLADRYWPDGNALGAQVIIGGDGTFTPRTVVGIVSDARYHELENEPGLHIYLPFRQFPAFSMDVMARTAAEPEVIAATMREAVWSLRDDLAIRDISTMRRLVYADLVEPGFYTWLLASFATVAMVLAGIGIYASMAHATTVRTREIGIRVALGAQPDATVRMVMRGALYTMMSGTALGLAGAWATTRYLGGFLYEVEPTDAVAYASASLLFIALALLAAYVPARRAARVDPVIALRAD